MRNWKIIVSLFLCLIMSVSCCSAVAENAGGEATTSDQCAHANTATRVDEEIQDYYTSSMDGYHHYKPVFLYDVTYCTDCNAEIDREKQMTFHAAEVEEHVFDGGDVCVKCGDPYCDHANASWSYDWNEGITIDSTDKTYHVCSGTAYGNLWCPDCGYIIEENDAIPRTGVKEKHVTHDWEPNVCYVCGYKITCGHSNTKNIYDENSWSGSRENYSDPTVTCVDEKQHRVEGYRAWAVECLDCELTVGYGNDETPASELYPHTFVDGICEKCGYACHHEHTERWESVWLNITSIEAVDNGRHKVTGTIQMDTYCHDCGCVILREEEPRTDYILEHNYVDNVCTDCGHVCTCAHANADRHESIWLDITNIEPVDNTNHKVTGTIQMDTYCPDCDLVILREEEPRTDYIILHHYENDICVDCGYKNTCPHENTWENGFWLEGAEYTGVDNVHHKVNGTRRTEVWCNNCGFLVQENEEQCTDYLEEHYYVGGICENCGYVSTCAHANTERWDTYWEEGVSAVALNNGWHRISGIMNIDVYCYDCGVVVDRDQEERKDVDEQHFYPIGSDHCDMCGNVYTCLHENTVFWTEDIETGKGEALTESKYFHRAPKTMMLCTCCAFCGSELKRETITKNVVEPHVGDPCSICGYSDEGSEEPNTCEHVDQETYTYYQILDETTYEYTDENSHMVHHVNEVSYTVCFDCLEMVEPYHVINTDVSYSEEHAFSDGGRCECGLLNDCPHDGEIDTRYYYWQDRNGALMMTFEQLNSEQHKATGYVISRFKYCKLCNQELSSELVDDVITFEFHHSMKDGVCEECGYTAETEPTAVTLPLDISLISGETLNVTVGHEPADIQLPALTWSSSAPEVASVSDGVVTAHSAGIATVTVTCGSLSDSMVITVYDALTHTVMPDSLSAIEAEALMNANLERVTLPSGCKSIGSRAFAGNASLVRVHIPASVTSIAEDAFDGCAKLTISGEEGSYAQTFAEQNGIPFKAR